jgi:hypothetical protein
MLADQLKVIFYTKQPNGLHKSGFGLRKYAYNVTVYNLIRIRKDESTVMLGDEDFNSAKKRFLFENTSKWLRGAFSFCLVSISDFFNAV